MYHKQKTVSVCATYCKYFYGVYIPVDKVLFRVLIDRVVTRILSDRDLYRVLSDSVLLRDLIPWILPKVFSSIFLVCLVII